MTPAWRRLEGNWINCVHPCGASLASDRRRYFAAKQNFGLPARDSQTPEPNSSGTFRCLTETLSHASDYERSETDYLVLRRNIRRRKIARPVNHGREEDIEAMEAQVRGLEGRVVGSQIQLEDSTLRRLMTASLPSGLWTKDKTSLRTIGSCSFRTSTKSTSPWTFRKRSWPRFSDPRLSAVRGNQCCARRRVPGRIREVAQVADPVTQTFNVRVAMEAPQTFAFCPA